MKPPSDETAGLNGVPVITAVSPLAGGLPGTGPSSQGYRIPVMNFKTIISSSTNDMAVSDLNKSPVSAYTKMSIEETGFFRENH